jgi:hypothetical protein
VEQYGFSREELKRMTLGAAAAAFLLPPERARLRATLLEGYDGSQHAATGTA